MRLFVSCDAGEVESHYLGSKSCQADSSFVEYGIIIW